jgi:hypothetical protein
MMFPLHISAWELHSHLPIWLCAALGCTTIVLVIVLHRRQRFVAGDGMTRLFTALRSLTILLTVALLVAPSRVSNTLRHTRGPLLIVLDDSSSMNRIDAHQSSSRSSLARDALHSIEKTLDQFDVRIVAMSHPISPAVNTTQWLDVATTLLANPQANQSALGDALHHLATSTSEPVTVLLVSDGRQNAGDDPAESARLLAANGSRVFTLSVGSSDRVRDASVDFIDAPDSILTGDNVPLSATIRLDAIRPDETVTATLSRDGIVITQKPVTVTPTATVDFIDPAPPQGDHLYEIAIANLPSEASVQNNHLAAKVSVKSEKTRVLLIEDEPRWEFQFLKNLLMGDRRVELQTSLLQPAHIENIAASQPASIPSTVQSWSSFDVIILGDISPQRFTSELQLQLASALRTGKPKGLILIAGPRNIPARFAAAPLATLLPIDLTQTPIREDFLQETRRGFLPAIAPQAPGSILTRLYPDDQTNRSAWSALSPWFWHDEHTAARPGATVLLETSRQPESAIPSTKLQQNNSRVLLATMNYGAGRVLYLASPETWRMRYVQIASGLSDDLHRRFWSQAIRWAIAGEPAPDSSASHDLEDRNQSADPQRLQAIALAGHGQSFAASDVAKLADALPNQDHVDVQTSRIGLFENPAWLSTRYVHWAIYVAIIALLSTEWALRKRRGLV